MEMMIGALEVNMEYVYYHLKTNSLSEKWNTAEIEDYLKNCGMSREAGKPSYVMTQPFLSVFPLNVSDYAELTIGGKPAFLKSVWPGQTMRTGWILPAGCSG